MENKTTATRKTTWTLTNRLDPKANVVKFYEDDWGTRAISYYIVKNLHGYLDRSAEKNGIYKPDYSGRSSVHFMKI